jgi:uncharacterized protein
VSGERDLDRMLAALRPQRRPGEFVFVAAGPGVDLHAEAMVREAEGVTLVVDRGLADAHGLRYDFVGAWITLSVHSALDAVGLTAAVAGALAAAGIACNVLAGRVHDHLLVPAERADEALELLAALAARAAG